MSKEFAGTLRERIRIERPSPERDAIGADSTETELVGEFWAAIEAQGSGQESRADSRSAMQLWRFTVRQTDQIIPGDQLQWSDRHMVIRTVSEDRRLLPKTILEVEEKR